MEGEGTMKEAVEEVVRESSVLIDKEGLSNLYESVLKIAGFGLGGILYTAGKKAGNKGAVLLKDRLGVKGLDLIEAMVLAFEVGNWGKMRVEDVNEELYRVTVTENVLVSSMEKRREKPVCHPLAGYIAGFFELALEDKVQVKEQQCMGKGDSACVFEVKVG